MYTKYQIWVAGDDDMEKYGLPFKTESEAIATAKNLKHTRTGSVIVEKISTEIIFEN